MLPDCRIALKLIRSAQHISLVIHRQPDGDAIGSALALALALENLNKNSEIVCVDPLPAVFKRLTAVSPVVRTKISRPTDLVILLDCSESHRTGLNAALLKFAHKKPIIVIDHHGNGNGQKWARALCRDTKASSTAEILYEFFGDLRVKITPAIAQSLLVGLYTDTGGFQHPNVSGRTFQIASRLIRCGANVDLIKQNLRVEMPSSKKRLWGRVLSKLKINRFGVITAIIDQECLAATQASPEDVLGLANILALTDQAKIALVLIETEAGWRGTLRTRYANINLTRLAKLLGGKGRQKAAGFLATKEVFSGKIK